MGATPENSLRVALCQINTVVGAFQKNALRILEFVKKSQSLGAQLIVFPECSLSSYPPLDLLDRRDFISAQCEAFQWLLLELKKLQNDSVVILGVIQKNPEPSGRAILNTAVTIEKGTVVHTQIKQLLPTYSVFDESRYYEPGKSTKPWSGAWGKVGVAVCEDSWYEDLHQGRRIYTCEDPANALKGCDLIVNTSASPYEIHKQHYRDYILSGFVKRVGAPMIYVNQVGANDEIIFDGDSRVFDGNGVCRLKLPSFQEGIGIVNIDFRNQSFFDSQFYVYQQDQFSEMGSALTTTGANDQPKNYKDTQNTVAMIHDALVLGIRDYFKKTGFKRAVLGLSGGIDSAVVAVLAAEAIGRKNVYGYSLPSQFSSTHSLDDAAALAKNLGINYGGASIKFLNSAALLELKNHFQHLPEGVQNHSVAEENLQSRLRGLLIMAIANKYNALALTTGNKSEMAVGYCTIYGDMNGALAPLGDVYKMKVYELAKFINRNGEVIPQSTMTKPPSAELRPGQTDQDSLPDYEVLDAILESYLEGGASVEDIIKAGFEEGIVKRVLKLLHNSEFKRRQAAPVLRVTGRAFGIGRRVPVARVSES